MGHLQVTKSPVSAFIRSPPCRALPLAISSSGNVSKTCTLLRLHASRYTAVAWKMFLGGGGSHG